MSLIERIEAIPWFGSVGMPLRGVGFRTTNVSSWPEAIALCRSIEWENFNIDRQNDLTRHLNHKCKDEFQKWNTFAREIKEQLQQRAWPTMRQYLADRSIPHVVADCVEWDTAGAAITEKYVAYSPPSFSLDVLQIYEKGHFPCGWKGEWPDGELIVF